MTKKNQKENCRIILSKYNSGSTITNIDDYEFLISIFEKHEFYSIKAGCGIKRIFVGNSKYGQKQFMIERLDNSITDISFLKSIDGQPTKLSQINQACRSAIVPIILDYRHKNVVFGETICPFTGETLTIGNCHIDHYSLTFRDVFKEWMKLQDFDYLYSKLSEHTNDLEENIYFKDEKIIKDFQEFHNKNTHLRAVSKIANLTILK